MFKFLEGFQFWQVLSLAIIVVGSILLIIFRGKITFFNGSKRIEVNRKGTSGAEFHSRCPYVYDIFGIINKTMEISSRITSIKDCLLKDQMKYTNQKLLIFIDLMRQSFIEKLIELGEKDPTKIEGYNSYYLLLELLEYKLSTFFRNTFIDNNIKRFQNEDKTIDIDKFNKYTEEKVRAVESTINELLDTHYNKISKINREELRKVNETVSPSLDKMLAEIVSNALEIAINNYKKIISLDMELKKHIKQTVGIDFTNTENN